MIRVRLDQGSPAWLAWRRDGLGASDARVVMGTPHFPDEGLVSLFREKVRGIGRESNFAMRRGVRLEPEARSLYSLANRCRVEVFCAEHGEVGWLRASLDGYCTAPGAADWLIEIKCPRWQDHDLALAGMIPPHYVPQVQHALFVAGVGRLDYVSYNPSARFGPDTRLAVVQGIEPDPEWLGEYLPRAEKVWGTVRALRERRTRRALACQPA